MDDVGRVNNSLDLLWISCGTKDSRCQEHLSFVDGLRKAGVECEFYDASWGHEWQFWRLQLHDFAQRLFR